MPALSHEFINAFLTVCFDVGMSKAAAAELLQKESTAQELRQRPAFAEGYHAVARQVPGQMVALKAGYECLEKLATTGGVMRGLGNLGKALFVDSAKAVWQIGKGLGSNTVRGVETVKDSPFLKTHPFASVVGASAATGAGVAGLNYLANRDRSLMPAKPTPFFSPSGYSPEAYQKSYDSALDSYTPGIFDHNKDYFGTEGRRKEIEEAIAAGKGGGNAYRELIALKRQHATHGSARKRRLGSLDEYQDANRDLSHQVGERVSSLEAQRKAWWAAPKRWALSATGQDPQRYFDDKISGLQDTAAAAKREADLAEDQRRLIWAGATEKRETAPPTGQQIQQRFFPQF